MDVVIIIVSKASKFSNDTKLGGMMVSVKNCKESQFDWKRADGCDKCFVCFIVKSYEVMHIGNDNPNFWYIIHWSKFSKIKWEKDIGIIISNILESERWIDPNE